jgi:tRNA wybutosine-synthesizing protein 4
MSKEVQATGLDAVVSKLSSASKGYFHDPFLLHFVPEKERKRRSPLINRGYYARFRMFELMLKRFETVFGANRQIISLGGGSETIYFRLKMKNKQPKQYIEVDMEPIANLKTKIISENVELSQYITNRNESKESPEKFPLVSDGYRILSCDLTDSKRLFDLLLNECEIDLNLPTLFISECVLVYVDPESSGNIIEWIAKCFPLASFITYEQINPYDAFGEQMMSNLKRRGCELKGIQAHPDLPSQESRFLSRGWTNVKALDMKRIYYEILSKKDRARIEKLEIFDEFEEFFLIMQHYSFTLATMNTVHEKLTLDPEGDADELAD